QARRRRRQRAGRRPAAGGRRRNRARRDRSTLIADDQLARPSGRASSVELVADSITRDLKVAPTGGGAQMSKLSGAATILIAAALAATAAAQQKPRPPAAPKPITPKIAEIARPLPLDAVRLTGGPLKHAQDLDAEYLLKLEPDRMLAFYRERAGLQKKAE